MADRKRLKPGLKARVASGFSLPAGEDLGSPQAMATHGMPLNSLSKQREIIERMKRRQDENASITRRE